MVLHQWEKNNPTWLAKMNGGEDHVHLLIEYPPHVAISSLVNSLKGVSSRLPRQEFPDLAQRYYKDILWSPSYFAASCGAMAFVFILRSNHFIDLQTKCLIFR